MKYVVLLLVLVGGEPSRAHAFFLNEPAIVSAPPGTVDIWLLGSTVPVWAAEGLLVSSHTWPTDCVWCGEFEPDTAVRDAILDPDTKNTWQHLSDYGLWPLAGAVGVATVWISVKQQAAVPLLPISEGLIMAGTINALTKALTARPRPYTLTFPAGTRLSPSDLASFTSGHTSFAFSLATTFVLTGDALGWSAWYTAPPGFAVASLVGYARLAADKHWLTDVVGAAATGVGGVFLAWWLRQPDQEPETPRTVMLPKLSPDEVGVQLIRTF